MNHNNALFWIWLAETLGQRNRDFRRLIELYESPYDLFHADEAELEHITNVAPRTKRLLADKSLKKASDIVDRCQKLGIGILPYHDSRYPDALREIQNPPILLYYKGTMVDFQTNLCLGLVGTRRMSAYGLHSAYKISYELAATGVVIVSGMAEGIDGVCAAAAVAAGGKTVAVFGCGIDVVYPPHHRALCETILKNGGLLISEYPPGSRPIQYHFPVRNRIISGLSRGTVVIEAGLRSGSLITAKEAILQGREVYALPANMGSKSSEGANGLLRDGAHLVLRTMDILERYRYVYSSTLKIELLSKAEKSSATNLEFLNRLGVIKVDKKTESTANRETTPRSNSKPKSAAKPRREEIQKSATPADETVSSHQTVAPKSKTPDAVISSLSELQLAILNAIPDDRAVSAESLNALDYPYGEIIASLTMLEIMGLVQKLPGALYTKL